MRRREVRGTRSKRPSKGVLDTDIYVVTVPMWNFGIPYALKYYIDAIVQPGYLFKYDELGQPHGMVHGKKMVCVTSRGADYSQPPLLSLDYVDTYLRTIFGFVGITDVKFFNAQPMDISPESRKVAVKATISEVRSWVAEGAWGASPVQEPAALPEDIKPQVINE